MGWSCMVFYSTVIVTYGFFSATFDFLNNVSFVEIVSEKTFVYFLFHFIILFLIFRPSLIRNFNFSQKILSLYNLDISNYIGVVFDFIAGHISVGIHRSKKLRQNKCVAKHYNVFQRCNSICWSQQPFFQFDCWIWFVLYIFNFSRMRNCQPTVDGESKFAVVRLTRIPQITTHF